MSSQDERNGGGQKSCGSFTSRPKHSQSDDSTMALLNWSAEVVLGRSYMLSNLCCQLCPNVKRELISAGNTCDLLCFGKYPEAITVDEGWNVVKLHSTGNSKAPSSSSASSVP